MNRQKGYLLGLLSGLFWGMNTTISSYLMLLPAFIMINQKQISSTLVIVFLHDLLSAVILSFIVFRQNKLNNRSIIRLISSKSLYIMMLSAIFAGPIGMRANLIAIHKIGPDLSSIISAVYPVSSAILASIFLNERFRYKNILGLLLTFIAVAILGYSGISFSSIDSLGFIYAVICVASWSSESIICAYGMGNDISPEEALFVRQCTSSFINAIFLIVGNNISVAFNVMYSPLILELMLLLAIVGTLSYLSYYKAIDHIGAVKATGLNVTYSLWTVLFSLIVFGGQIDWRLIFCGILIILGSILVVNENIEG